MPFIPVNNFGAAQINANQAAIEAAASALQSAASASLSQGALATFLSGKWSFPTTTFANLIAPLGGATAIAVITDSPIFSPGAIVSVGGGDYTVLVYYNTALALWRVAS